MTRPWARVVAGAALCASLACDRVVTVYLLPIASDGGAVPPPACQKLGPEVCNGGDDDCNGGVDEGCGTTISWIPAPDGVVLGHATGGVTFAAPCPTGAALTGLLVGMGKWLNQVVAVCHQVVLNADHPDASATSATVTLGPRFDTSFAPAVSQDPSNQVHELLCPDGLVLSGLDGTTTTDTPRYILGIGITCAPPVVTMAAGGSVLDSDRTREQKVGPLVCATCAATQAFNVTTSVEVGQLATRLFGGDGLWIDRLGVGASQASLKNR